MDPVWELILSFLFAHVHNDPLPFSGCPRRPDAQFVEPCHTFILVSRLTSMEAQTFIYVYPYIDYQEWSLCGSPSFQPYAPPPPPPCKLPHNYETFIYVPHIEKQHWAICGSPPSLF